MTSLPIYDLLRVSVKAHAHSSLAHVKREGDADGTDVALATGVDLAVRDFGLVQEHARREVAALQPGHLAVRLAHVDLGHLEVGRERVRRDRMAPSRSRVRRRCAIGLTRAAGAAHCRRRWRRDKRDGGVQARGGRHLRGMVAARDRD